MSLFNGVYVDKTPWNLRITSYGDIYKNKESYVFKNFVIGYSSFFTKMDIIKAMAIALKEVEPERMVWPDDSHITNCTFVAANPIAGLLLPLLKWIHKMDEI